MKNLLAFFLCVFASPLLAQLPSTSVQSPTGLTYYGEDILSPNKPTGVLAAATGKNVTVAASATQTLLNYTGGQPGYVQSIWVAINDGGSGTPNGLNLSTINIYYDGHGTADISMRATMFFNCQYGYAAAPGAFANRLFGGSGASAIGQTCYTYLPIPYNTQIKITLTNGNSTSVVQIWYDITYQTGVPNTWNGTRVLHAVATTAVNCSINAVETLFSSSSLNPGRYVGTWMLTDDVPGSVSVKGGELEGAFNIYTDSNVGGTPNYSSSGTEDYFECGYYGRGCGAGGYSNGWSGTATYNVGQFPTTVVSNGWTGNGEVGTTFFSNNNLPANYNSTSSFFRYHLSDPIRFQNGLGIVWNCGNSSAVNWTGTSQLFAVVYYYTN